MAELVLSPDTPLTLAALVRAARDPLVRVIVPATSRQRLRDCRQGVDAIVANYTQAWESPQPFEAKQDRQGNPIVDLLRYGITTGFGEFKNKPIRPEHLVQLQEKILRSHAVGVCANLNQFSPENFFPGDVVRAALIIRIQTFLLGYSGIRESTLDVLLYLVNAGVVPLVPSRGSVGSSGDLAPLAHLFATLIGEGHYYVARSAQALRDGLSLAAESCDEPSTASGAISLRCPTIWPARMLVDELCRRLSLQPQDLKPQPKEGLALTNGATFCAATLALAVHDAEVLIDSADAAVALTLEAICGRVEAFDPRVHAARGQVGQIRSARTIRALIEGSRWLAADQRTKDVQDSYSVRCAPAVHGASRDTLEFARSIVTAEINAATDNPLVFDESEIDPDKVARLGLKYDVYSAGNFHGQPLGLAADFLAIAVAELANISERRIQMLLDENHSRGLPPNLIAFPGVNSGYMLTQYTAAALVSENKILCHPASVDSIPTSANIEDHVAMATTATRKLQSVIHHTRSVLGIELMVSAQAVEWRALPEDLSPPSAGLVGRRPYSGLSEAAQKSLANPEVWEDVLQRREQKFAEFFACATDGCYRKQLADSIGRGSGEVYLAVRNCISSLVDDRYLAPSMHRAAQLVASESIAAIVHARLEA